MSVGTKCSRCLERVSFRFYNNPLVANYCADCFARYFPDEARALLASRAHVVGTHWNGCEESHRWCALTVAVGKAEGRSGQP